MKGSVHMRSVCIPLVAISIVVLSAARAAGQQAAPRETAGPPSLRVTVVRVYLRNGWIWSMEPNGRMDFGSGSSPADYASAQFAPEDYRTILKTLVASHDWERREGWYRVEVNVFVDEVDPVMRFHGYVEDVEFLRPWIDRILREYWVRVDAEFILGELAKRPAIGPPTTRPGR